MADTLSGQPMDEVLASIRRIIAEEKPIGSPPDEDVLELGAAAPPAASPAPPLAVTAPPAAAAEDGLLSAGSAAASRHALAQLSGLAIDPRAPANSLDGMVREMLRPMVKSWLDAHLPDLVERMVAREIARIGGR